MSLEAGSTLQEAIFFMLGMPVMFALCQEGELYKIDKNSEIVFSFFEYSL